PLIASREPCGDDAAHASGHAPPVRFHLLGRWPRRGLTLAAGLLGGGLMAGAPPLLAPTSRPPPPPPPPRTAPRDASVDAVAPPEAREPSAEETMLASLGFSRAAVLPPEEHSRLVPSTAEACFIALADSPSALLSLVTPGGEHPLRLVSRALGACG